MRKRKRHRYPWSDWLDGKGRVLQRGQDYFCSTEALVTSSYRAATKQDKQVIVIRLDGNRVYLRLRTKARQDQKTNGLSPLVIKIKRLYERQAG